MSTLSNYYNPKLLAELAAGYGGRKYIAARALPVVQIPDKTASFIQFDKTNMVLDVDSARTSPKSDVAEIDFGESKVDIAAKGYGYKHFVPNAIDEDQAGTYLRAATQTVMDTLLNIRESIVLSKILACGNATTISTKWDAASTDFGTVVKGVEAMQADLYGETGQPGNVLIVGSDVWSVMAQRAQGQWTQPTPANRQLFAELLGVDEILVSRIKYVTKKNAGSFDNAASFWTAKYAALLNNGMAGRMDDSGGDLGSDEFTPAYGKIAQWTGGSTINGIEWSSYEWQDKGSHGGAYIRGTMYFDAVETLNKAATLGVVLT